MKILRCMLSLAFAALALPSHGSADATPVSPLARAHAHNDYEHERPLFDALEQGFTSVEADIWLVDGELRVAHDLDQAQPGRTLEALYLEPLRAIVRAQGGHVYPGFDHSVQLLIDIKSDGASTYGALHEVLTRYADILSTFTQHTARERAVTAVISGNRPLERMARQHVRFAAYDGRWSDTGTDADAAFIPLVSDNWANYFKWTGAGAMPEDEKLKLSGFVASAHAQRRRVRMWATPEDPQARQAVWSALIEAGVDYINTDDLSGLRAFLLQHDTHPSAPELDWFGDYGELVPR